MLLLFFLEDPTEPVKLEQNFFVFKELLSKRPRILKHLENFHQFVIFAELGINHMDVLSVFSAQYSESVKARFDILSHLHGCAASFFVAFEESFGALERLCCEIIPTLAFVVCHSVDAADCSNQIFLRIIKESKRATLFSD